MAIVTGTDRVLSRNTFPEFKWGRATFMVPWSKLPAGFAAVQELLGGAVEVLQDIYVLQKTSELIGKTPGETCSVHDMDNQQACIESRLNDCLQGPVAMSSLLTSILLASYVYTYSLFTEVWNGYWIPFHISKRLLCHLESSGRDDSWTGHDDILLWCTVVGGCLSPPGEMRSKYVIVLREYYQSLGAFPISSWTEAEEVLDSFLWSRKHFDSCGNTFWQETLAQNSSILFPNRDEENQHG